MENSKIEVKEEKEKRNDRTKKVLADRSIQADMLLYILAMNEYNKYK